MKEISIVEVFELMDQNDYTQEQIDDIGFLEGEINSILGRDRITIDEFSREILMYVHKYLEHRDRGLRLLK
jgi:hypothetical protein